VPRVEAAVEESLAGRVAVGDRASVLTATSGAAPHAARVAEVARTWIPRAAPSW